MITANVNYSGLDAGIKGLIYRVGLNSRTVLAKEMGELIKTLVKVSPPESRPKTNENIKRDITGKFATASDENNSLTEGMRGQVGPAGILWYEVNGDFLKGIAPQNDQRGASVQDLERMRWNLSRKGSQKLPFRHPRTHQRVIIRQTILSKVSTVNKLIAQARSHVGRLKAAWLVSVTAGAIRLTGSNMPLGWVTKHASGAKGSFTNGLSDPKHPKFTIMNFARGIGQRKVNGLVQIAVKIRSKAMAGNIALFLKGKKKLSDYK